MTNLVPAGNESFKWRINLNALEKALPKLSIFEAAVPNSQYRFLLQSLDTTLRYAGPTLFVAGKKSNYVTLSYPTCSPIDCVMHHPEIKKFFPNFQLQMIEDAGHWIHSEQPEKFVETVQEFLNK